MYSRENPSKRYITLIKQYQELHIDGQKNTDLAPRDTFPGHNLIPQAPDIKRIIEKTNAKFVLDYGSGKGRQYTNQTLLIDNEELGFDGIKDYWGVEDITCYDPCYTPFSNLPDKKFDGVICTDVLEHCPEEDIDWIIDELFSFSTLFLFANIACYPAKKILPNGENAHCTVKSAVWWLEKIKIIAARHPTILFEFKMDMKTVTETGDKFIIQRIANFNY